MKHLQIALLTFYLLLISLFPNALLANGPDKKLNQVSQSHSLINLNNVHQHIKVLASDKFAGRGPLSQGETLTINYLAKYYQQYGLKPGSNNSYLQKVPMAKLTPNPDMQLKIGQYQFSLGNEFTARTTQIKEQIKLNHSELVFVGYGINAPEYQWNDYANIDVKGKTVIVLVNDPGFATQNEKLFTGNAMTYYGRWTYKYEEAARQGAAAVLIVHETAAAGYPWSVVDSSNTGSKFTLVDQHNNASHLPIMGWIHKDVALKVFKQSGLDFLSLKMNALAKNFTPIKLKQTAELTLNSQIEKAESNNVVALIPGTTQKDEYIILGAHWDHFGIQKTASGDKIYNGAVDNASGTAATLELARMLAEQAKKKPFKRSILVVNFTAEEAGLIGSEMFAKSNLYPTSQMVGILNIDGMNPHDEVGYILQYGKNMSQMENYLADAAKSQGRQVKMDPVPQNGLFFRSDHFSMAKQGVPGILFMSLGDTDPEYISHKYHKEADDYSSSWSLGGVKQDIQLIYQITNKLANNNDWPKWLADSDFKKYRAQDKK